MSAKNISDKTSIANVVSGLAIVLGLGYFIATKHTEGVIFIVGAAIGYLLPTAVKASVQNNNSNPIP